jgi:hypothetical protein
MGDKEELARLLRENAELKKDNRQHWAGTVNDLRGHQSPLQGGRTTTWAAGA